MVKGGVHTCYNVPFRPRKLFEDCVCGLSGCFFFQARPPYKVEQEEGVPDERSLLQDCLPMKFQDLKLKIRSSSMKFFSI